MNIERLTTLEIQMRVVLEKQEKLEQRWEQVDSKLDDLLGLKHKGLGAFWLASTLFGTGLVGALLAFVDYVKGA